MADEEKFEGWAILELMGHRRLGGTVRDETLAGAAFIRIDVPRVEGVEAFTQFYAPGAVYCITPTTEAIARGVASRLAVQPVSRYELPALPGPSRGAVVDVDRDGVDDDDDDETP